MNISEMNLPLITKTTTAWWNCVATVFTRYTYQYRRLVLRCFLLSVSLSCPVARAQVGVGEAVKNQLIDDWKRARLYTQECLAAMPAGRYDFKPEAGARTFGQQMLHVAQYNYILGVGPLGGALPYRERKLETEPVLLRKDSIDRIVLASYEAVITRLQTTNANTLFDKDNENRTHYTFLLKAFEHQTHHRGAVVLYLRMVGIKPPPERLF